MRKCNLKHVLIWSKGVILKVFLRKKAAGKIAAFNIKVECTVTYTE